MFTYQISMSVVVLTVVMKMLHAVTLMAVTRVTAILGGVEMDSTAQVRGTHTLLLHCVCMTAIVHQCSVIRH